MYVLDTDASVVAISGILHQEQEWNGKTVLRPIAYGSKVLSDTEMKYGAPKAEMFAVVPFEEKYRAYLGFEPFQLRIDNRALSWLKTYSMNQSYIGRWIVLDGYDMIIEHKTRDKHQNADSLSKKTEFYERQEQKEADRPEIKDDFSFIDKETYDSFPLTRWLGKSGKSIEDHPELPAEHETKEILKGKTGMPIEMMLKSKIKTETLKAKGYDLDDAETRRDLLYHTADGVVACRRKDEEKILYKHNLIILPQLYQREVLFRSHDQMVNQGRDKVQQRILLRFD